MIVAFNPMINTGASYDAAYMNFLRCVKAIATASAGTSSLTVNPFTTNTGTIDNTRNCIVSIIANTEGGGWTESASSNVVNSGSFTSIASATGYTYKFDAYTASGKGVYPYLKFTCSTMTGSAANDLALGNQAAAGSSTAPTVASGGGAVPVMCTFGYSTTSDWTDTKYPPGNGTWTTIANTGIFTGPSAKTSVSYNYNSQQTSNSGTYYPTSGSAFIPFDTNRIFYMACTANYVIIWEQNSNNSYLNGYANQLTTIGYNIYSGDGNYGTLWASGFREAQAWENSYANNPTVYSMWIIHQRTHGGSNSNQMPLNCLWAPMLTINDSGVISTTLVTNVISNNSPAGAVATTELFGNPGNWNPMTNTNGVVNSNSALDQPVMLRETIGGTHSNQIYKPGVDNSTGVAVPAAYPVIVRRSASGSWNNGGAIRGIYKSLSMPIGTMRNYFANGQTFNIYNAVTATTDTYLPIVFNEDMWLVRYA